MKNLLTTIISLVFLTTHFSIFASTVLKTDKQKYSYALGLNVPSNLQSQGIDLDYESFVQGVKDTLLKLKPQMTEKEMTQTLRNLSQSLQSKQIDQNQVAKNTQEGEIYMAKNKQDKTVKQTLSGLQYKVVHLGKGKKPLATDRVKVHYVGTFINGKEFDSSYKRGQPATFALNQVIKGWTEVLQLMPTGSKFKVAIPGHLAYGKNASPSIGPNRTLLFDIELISIE